MNSMIKESSYCTDIVKSHLSKQLLMTKKDEKHFENSSKCWICDNNYVDFDVKLRGHCHMNRKCRRFANKFFFKSKKSFRISQPTKL